MFLTGETNRLSMAGWEMEESGGDTIVSLDLPCSLDLSSCAYWDKQRQVSNIVTYTYIILHLGAKIRHDLQIICID